jgi:hypothetical protein
MSNIAVLITERQAEALRMSSGLIVLDDTVEIFFLDTKVESSDEVEMMLEITEEMELPLYSNVEENTQTTVISTAELHTKLLDFDHIVMY